MRLKTTHLKSGETARDWHLADAEGQVLGRLAVQIAMILMGKHLPTYSPHLDGGDSVVVVNVEKIAITGAKAEQKEYARFSGYAGGRKTTTYAKMLEEHPDRILKKAVERMLPKNRLRRERMAKMFVYAGGEHPHGAQQPKPLARAS
ncbi:MAG: 50S ribosomal protein L13 [Planctomycetota bacterium]|nr:50S ribosomal protein L13 [Planctomycetota bacterium]